MAKRNSQNLDDSVNMDSMMDNMTNVVGTLLLVLIVVQLKIGMSANQNEENLSNVKAEDIEAAKAQVAKTEADMKKLGVDETALDEKLKGRAEDLRQFQKTVEKQGVNIEDLEKTKAEVAEKRKVEEKIKQEMNALHTARDKLKAQLDTTPVPVAPPPVDIRVPVPKPIPAGAEFFNAIVISNKVYMLTDVVIRKRVLDEFDQSKFNLVYTNRTENNGTVTTVYNHKETRDLFIASKFSDDFMEAIFPLNELADRIAMQIRPRPDAGETAEQLDDDESKYRKFLVKLRARPKAVMWFKVDPSSIATYLKAREQCTRYSIAAGWEFSSQQVFGSENLPFVVNRIKEPPPPPPRPPPPPPGTVPPPPPPAPVVAARPTIPTVITIAPPKKSLD